MREFKTHFISGVMGAFFLGAIWLVTQVVNGSSAKAVFQEQFKEAKIEMTEHRTMIDKNRLILDEQDNRADALEKLMTEVITTQRMLVKIVDKHEEDIRDLERNRR